MLRKLLLHTLQAILLLEGLELYELISSTKRQTRTLLLPQRGNKHHFFSLSPYYWPDPNNPNAPYILKDGHTNPESTAIPDKQKLSDMTYKVKILSLAYHYTNDSKYASLFYLLLDL
jgi:hypothetical protein